MIKKIIVNIFKTLFFIILILNLVILFSGRWYLWKGLWNTYLKGRSGPSATEYTIFENRKINATHPEPWLISKLYNTKSIPEEYVQKLKEIDTHAFLVIRNDSIIHEQYWDGFSDTSHTNSFSMAKTYVSILLGCALHDGSIKSIDEPVGTYIPSFKEGEKSKITLRHLVTMSSGLDYDESYLNPFSYPAEGYYGSDVMDVSTRPDVKEEPGKVFRYLSGNTALLGYCISKATGKTLSEYCSEKLWSPIGCEQPAWWSLDHKDGQEKGFCCLNSNARDFSRIGKLYMHQGNWEGRQIVDSSYVLESIKPFDALEEDGTKNHTYGYAWWLTERQGYQIFYARGILSQYVICIPEKNMIVCRLGRKKHKPNNDHCPLDAAICIDAALKMFGN